MQSGGRSPFREGIIGSGQIQPLQPGPSQDLATPGCHFSLCSQGVSHYSQYSQLKIKIDIKPLHKQRSERGLVGTLQRFIWECGPKELAVVAVLAYPLKTRGKKAS